MTLPAPHLQDVVTGYLRGHPDEQSLLQPLQDRLAAGANVSDRRDFDGHVTASGVVINDADDVLLIHHLASGRWIQPGGHPEDSDRTLEQTVRREVAEETGVTELEAFGDGTPVHIDIHTIAPRPDKNEPAHVHYDVRYLFRVRGSVGLTLQAEEVGAVLGHLNVQTTRGYDAVFDEGGIRHYQEHLEHRRQIRPTDEYRDVTADEWSEFEEHFDRRKVELGSCGRPLRHPPASTNTPASHNFW
ncbi:NUDIX hydrolase [Streptomyces sp. NPDC054842]